MGTVSSWFTRCAIILMHQPPASATLSKPTQRGCPLARGSILIGENDEMGEPKWIKWIPETRFIEFLKEVLQFWSYRDFESIFQRKFSNFGATAGLNRFFTGNSSILELQRF